MFTVTGFLDGEAYAVAVDTADPDPVVGSPSAVQLLDSGTGESYQATPTGPAGTLDLSDPASILGALYGWTTVSEVLGDAPDIGLEEPDPLPGLTY